MKNGDLAVCITRSIAPFKIQIIPKMDNEEKVNLGNELYNKLCENNIEAILDDRENLSIGSKIKDAKVLGTPYLAVLGDKQEGNNIELEDMKTGNKQIISIENLLKLMK